MLRNQAHPVSNPKNVAVGAVSAQSAAMGANAKYLRIAVTVDTYIAIGANPTAAITSLIMPAGSVEIFPCAGSDKVACLQVSTGGFMSVTESIQA